MNTPDDTTIVRQLRELLRSQQLPADDLLDTARSVFDHRSIDDEIGELVTDTFEQLPAGVRRRFSLERDLTFGFGNCDLTLRLDGPDLLGQLMGAEMVSATLVGTVDSIDLEVDETSGFVTDRPEAGPVRFVVVTRCGRRLSTEWIRL